MQLQIIKNILLFPIPCGPRLIITIVISIYTAFAGVLKAFGIHYLTILTITLQGSADLLSPY